MDFRMIELRGVGEEHNMLFGTLRFFFRICSYTASPLAPASSAYFSPCHPRAPRAPSSLSLCEQVAFKSEVRGFSQNM